MVRNRKVATEKLADKEQELKEISQELQTEQKNYQQTRSEFKEQTNL